MNVDELRQRLLTDPYDRDPDLEAAKSESLEHRRVARESEDFEARLNAALCSSTDAPTVESVLGSLPIKASNRRPLFAIAASLAFAALVGIMLTTQQSSNVVRDALVEHFGHDEPGALESTQPLDLARAIDLLAEVDAQVVDSMSLTYARRCYIGGIEGLHLVLTGASGEKTSVLFMPTDERVREGEIDVSGAQAQLVAVSRGAVGVFVHDDAQSIDDTVNALYSGTQALSFLAP